MMEIYRSLTILYTISTHRDRSFGSQQYIITIPVSITSFKTASSYIVYSRQTSTFFQVLPTIQRLRQNLPDFIAVLYYIITFTCLCLFLFYLCDLALENKAQVSQYTVCTTMWDVFSLQTYRVVTMYLELQYLKILEIAEFLNHVTLYKDVKVYFQFYQETVWFKSSMTAITYKWKDRN